MSDHPMKSFIDRYYDGAFNMTLWCPSCKNRCVFTPPPLSRIGSDYMICSECEARCSWTAPAMERAKGLENPFVAGKSLPEEPNS